MTMTDDERNASQALGRARETMPADVHARVRNRVMTGVRAQARPPFFAAQSRRIAAAATAFTMLGGGVAYAADAALPGDALYPVKRAAESAVVALLPAGELENAVLVRLAERRAEEIGELVRQQEATAVDISATLLQLRNSVENAAAVSALEEQELVRIRNEAGEVPEWARDAIEQATTVAGPSGAGSDADSGTGTGTGTGTGASESPGATGSPDSSESGPDTSGSGDDSTDTGGSDAGPGAGSDAGLPGSTDGSQNTSNTGGTK